jgi:predicted O-linked N-acetylglucosamine transferase (SPINDLY family)
MAEESAQELLKKGLCAEAEAKAERDLLAKPGDCALLLTLGLAQLKSGFLEKAASNLRSFLEKRPSDAKARFNLACAYESAGRLPEAEELCRAALALDGRQEPARIKLAQILEKRGALSEAESRCREGLALTPESPDLLCAHGNALNALGRIAEALEEYKKAVALRPGDSAAESNVILAKLYLDDTDEKELFALQRRWAESREKPFEGRKLQPEPVEGRRLRIAYLSKDFRRHSVAFFIEPVLACHDKSRFEVTGLSDVAKPDAITERLRGLCERWEDVAGLSDDELERLVLALKPDILVDLAGRTSPRLSFLLRRVAPVQLAWIGYPASTGLKSVDYRISDLLADPPGQESVHSEKLLRLPGQFLVFSPPEDAPPLAEAPCLRNGYVTFGSFNAIAKLGPGCVKLWASVLKAVPKSRLFLKNNALGDAGVRARLEEAFALEGVEKERLELAAFDSSFAAHLASYAKMDIALDSYPYHGTTTTCEALWMGVPTLCLQGFSHRARVGLSLLGAVGLGSLAARSPAELAGLAKALSSDLRQLAAFKASLRNAMAASPLCDARGFAAAYEAKLLGLFPKSCTK